LGGGIYPDIPPPLRPWNAFNLVCLGLCTPLGGKGNPDPLNGHCKLPEQGSGQKRKDIWRNFC